MGIRTLFHVAWFLATVGLLFLGTLQGQQRPETRNNKAVVVKEEIKYVPVPVPVPAAEAAALKDALSDGAPSNPPAPPAGRRARLVVALPPGATVHTPVPEPPRGPVPWDRKFEEVTDGDPNHKVSDYAAHHQVDQVAPAARAEQTKRHMERLKELGSAHARTLTCDGLPRDTLPRFAIVTVAVSPPRHVANNAGATRPWMPPLSFQNKRAYAERWGYDLHVVGNDIIKGHESTPEIASFAKIMALRKWLPKYQWLVLLDMDLIITNMELSLESRLKGTTADQDIVMAKDWNGINSGVFFIRNSVYGMWFLDELRFGPRHWAHPWADQSVMNALLDPRRNQHLAAVFRPRFRWVSQQSMNAFGIWVPPSWPQGNWHRGMWLIHFPNCKGAWDCQAKMTKAFQETSDYYKLGHKTDAAVPPNGGCWGPHCPPVALKNATG